MKVILVENASKEGIGQLLLKTQPQNGEYVEFDHKLYSIHRIIHAEGGIKLMVIGIR